MWEITDLGSEDLLWATTNFVGGIASQREGVCGAISAAAVFLGLRHRCSLNNKEQADRARTIAREQARELVLSFSREKGDIICAKLTGININDPVAIQKFRESGDWMKKCVGYVQFVIKKLYELETK
jgi:C_GCAxxG_C_C family probable redox protein